MFEILKKFCEMNSAFPDSSFVVLKEVVDAEMRIETAEKEVEQLKSRVEALRGNIPQGMVDVCRDNKRLEDENESLKKQLADAKLNHDLKGGYWQTSNSEILVTLRNKLYAALNNDPVDEKKTVFLSNMLYQMENSGKE